MKEGGRFWRGAANKMILERLPSMFLSVTRVVSKKPSGRCSNWSTALNLLQRFKLSLRFEGADYNATLLNRVVRYKCQG
ncbi:hypothetical protein M0804_011924 [Polistes exclamans]|nr:hypothetical protein M0804_011924 [Polistes exclamans]